MDLSGVCEYIRFQLYIQYFARLTTLQLNGRPKQKQSECKAEINQQRCTVTVLLNWKIRLYLQRKGNKTASSAHSTSGKFVAL